MSFVINTMSAVPDRLPMHEVARYMGMRLDTMDKETAEKIQVLEPRFLNELQCRACWMEVPIDIFGDMVDLGLIKAESAHLSTALEGCTKAIVFAATTGSGVDRLCRAASVRFPSNALIFDAMGSAAIEWFCDEICNMLQVIYPQYQLRPRFSPGYGDLKLSCQQELLGILDARRKIGLTLLDSLMMVPQKSVSAIVGLHPYELMNDKEVMV